MDLKGPGYYLRGKGATWFRDFLGIRPQDDNAFVPVRSGPDTTQIRAGDIWMPATVQPVLITNSLEDNPFPTIDQQIDVANFNPPGDGTPPDPTTHTPLLVHQVNSETTDLPPVDFGYGINPKFTVRAGSDTFDESLSTGNHSVYFQPDTFTGAMPIQILHGFEAQFFPPSGLSYPDDIVSIIDVTLKRHGSGSQNGQNVNIPLLQRALSPANWAGGDYLGTAMGLGFRKLSYRLPRPIPMWCTTTPAQPADHIEFAITIDTEYSRMAFEICLDLQYWDKPVSDGGTATDNNNDQYPFPANIAHIHIGGSYGALSGW